MKFFVFWSGGKDCMLSLYRMLQDKRHDISHLLYMNDKVDDHLRVHGLHSSLMKQQASSLGLEIIQTQSDFKSYEIHLRTAIHLLKKKGVGGGVFGFISQQSQRDLIERICFEMDIIPVFPLWKNNTTGLLQELVELGFKSKVIAVNAQYLPESWLGREINAQFVSEISRLKAIDPGAVNGEYHTFVYDGPHFQQPVSFSSDPGFFKDNHWFLNLT